MRSSPTRPTRCHDRRRATNSARLCLRCSAARTCAAGRSSPNSTTAMSAKHRARRECRRRRAAGRRVHRARHRGVHRRFRPLHATGPVPGCATGAGRGVPQRRGHRRHPDCGNQLPELRLAGGSRCHVAVPEAVRGTADGCAALGIPVTGGNVSFSDRTGRRRSCPPRWSACSVSSTASAADPTGLGTDTGETLLLLGGRPRRVRRLDLGAGHRGSSGGSPPEVDLGREQLLAEVLAAGRP